MRIASMFAEFVRMLRRLADFMAAEESVRFLHIAAMQGKAERRLI
jgi:hypothetical protein